MLEAALNKEGGLDAFDLAYIVRVLQALNAAETFHALPVAGGFLNQPATLFSDMQEARQVIERRRRTALEAAHLMYNAMASSAMPEIPLPPIPEELL